ncbi:MAG: hypothetical protein LBJ15_22525 [Comamonas sp.]|uniref:hypothetical protein n=1 Tax=Comamonas sp. TaxID=34028 RepID=UPI002834FA95|nr:hypothetical protein [Comamonas sp.]MDR0216761.1 hypothetical protein [Comamonas sp.]
MSKPEKRVSRRRRKLPRMSLSLPEMRWSRESLVRRWRAQRQHEGVLVENWLVDCIRGGYLQLTLRSGRRTMRRMLTRGETDALIVELAIRVTDIDSGQSWEEGLAAAICRHRDACIEEALLSHACKGGE